MTQSALEQLWRRRAASLARHFNLGWWLERFNSLLLGGLLLFGILLLAARTWRAEWLSHARVGMSLAALFVLLGVAAWCLARRRFIGPEVGLVRLDDRLSLNNRLASASSAVGPWPEIPGDGVRPARFSWNAGRALFPGLGALLLVAAAWLAPIPKATPPRADLVEPGAWKQMEDWLATLKEEELIEEESISEFEGRIEELRDRPEEEWFSHSSLEATDTLRESLGRELSNLGEEMNALERDLSALQSFASQMSGEAREQREKEFEEALDALEGSGLEVNEALMKQLQEIDPSKLGQETMGGLSPEEMKALQEQLRKGSGALGSMEGLPPLDGGMGGDEGLAGLGGEGESPGKGDVSRGRADAPLFFGDEEDNLKTANLEQVTNDDLSKAAIGDALGIGETKREIDESESGRVGAGAVGSSGRGGQAVSREALLPDEQAALKRYFK